MNDTSFIIEDKMREMIRKKSPIERAKMGSSMYATSKYLVIRAIIDENPNISPLELKQEIFIRFYRDDYTPAECQKILKHFQDLEPD